MSSIPGRRATTIHSGEASTKEVALTPSFRLKLSLATAFFSFSPTRSPPLPLRVRGLVCVRLVFVVFSLFPFPLVLSFSFPVVPGGSVATVAAGRRYYQNKRERPRGTVSTMFSIAFRAFRLPHRFLFVACLAFCLFCMLVRLVSFESNLSFPILLSRGSSLFCLRIACHNNVRKRPLERYDLGDIHRRPGACTGWPERFLRKQNRTSWPPGAIKQNRACRGPTLVDWPEVRPGHQIIIWGAAARSGPSNFQRMGLGPARPINFQRMGRGPAQPITVSKFTARPGPAHHFFFISARPDPAHHMAAGPMNYVLYMGRLDNYVGRTVDLTGWHMYFFRTKRCICLHSLTCGFHVNC